MARLHRMVAAPPGRRAIASVVAALLAVVWVTARRQTVTAYDWEWIVPWMWAAAMGTAVLAAIRTRSRPTWVLSGVSLAVVLLARIPPLAQQAADGIIPAERAVYSSALLMLGAWLTYALWRYASVCPDEER